MMHQTCLYQGSYVSIISPSTTFIVFIVKLTTLVTSDASAQSKLLNQEQIMINGASVGGGFLMRCGCQNIYINLIQLHSFSCIVGVMSQEQKQEMGQIGFGDSTQSASPGAMNMIFSHPIAGFDPIIPGALTAYQQADIQANGGARSATFLNILNHCNVVCID